MLREQDSTDEEWERSDFYKEMYRPAGMYHGLGAYVLKNESHMAFFGINRAKGRNRFTSADIDLIRKIMPHVNRALQVTLKLADLKSQNLAYQAVWDTLAFGIALLDRDGKVLLQLGLAGEVG